MSELNEGLYPEAVEDLKPATGESPADYAARVKGVKERLRGEGYSVSEGWTLPGEDGLDAALERAKMLQSVPRTQMGTPGTNTHDTGQRKDAKMGEFSKAAADNRLAEHRKEAEKAISVFEGQAKKLQREDGERLYSEAEHQERHTALARELAEHISKITESTEEDARSYEATAKSYEYGDPVAGLPAADRERLTASAPLVKEDTEMLPVGDLVERLKAVRGGSDRLAKVLHARYARFRVRQISERRAQELQQGTASAGNPSGESASLRELEDLISGLEEDTAGPAVAESQEKARRAANESRELLREIGRRRSEVDGSNAGARQRAAHATRAAF